MASPTDDPNFDEDLIGEAAVAIPTALMPGAVKAYYNDQSKLKPDLKMAYIILQMHRPRSSYLHPPSLYPKQSTANHEVTL
jgi:hypothetical protein